MADAVEAAQPVIDAKQHMLRVDSPAAAIHLEVDPVRITQVITNLLTNAAKYTPPKGTITLGTRLEAHHLVIFVRDTGIGLSPDAMGKVFEMFTRVDSEIGRSEGGLGIGLALAKGLMELHDGFLKAHSAGRGLGSEFMMCLPRSLIVEAPAPISDASDGANDEVIPRRILIADDNRDSADTLSILFRLSGHQVYVAHSGTEALEVAKRVRPDIGVFDIGMPDMSGYDVAERIRHEAWGKKIKLIAVTGWGQDADKRRALAAGFDHHLTKPVDPERLQELFNN
jgi:CheY-like chemotaxis protein